MIDDAQEQRVFEFSRSTYSLLRSVYRHAVSKGDKLIDPALTALAVLKAWLKSRRQDHVNDSYVSARVARNCR